MYSISLGARYPDGYPQNEVVFAFDFGAMDWVQLGNRPSPDDHTFESTAVTDPETGDIWYQAGSPDGPWMQRLDPSTGTWTTWSRNGPGIYRGTGAIDGKSRQMVVAGNGFFRVWNLDNPEGSVVTASSGDQAVVNIQWPGFKFDPTRGIYVGWVGGTTVYELNPATWTWTAVNASGGAVPTSPPPQGIMGKFNYDPTRNIFVAVNDVDENVYIYKATDMAGSGVPRAPTVME
jgi:hypothetical protein